MPGLLNVEVESVLATLLLVIPTALGLYCFLLLLYFLRRVHYMLPLRRLACYPIRRNCIASVSSAHYYSGAIRIGSFTGTSPRIIAASIGNISIRYFTASPASRSDNMGIEDACREMEAAGVPKKGEPTAAAAPEQEQQKDLPKLSAAEFRVYNRMAEHMDMFVRFSCFGSGTSTAARSLN